MNDQQASSRTPGQDNSSPRPPARQGPGFIGKVEKPANARRALLRLVPYLTHYRFGLILVIVLVITATLLGLAGPILMGIAIDDYIANQNPAGLAWVAAWMMIVYLLDSLFNAASSWIMAGISQGALKTLRKDLFEHLQTLPLSFYDSRPAGELMSRLTNDIDAINQAVSQNVVGLIASTLSMAGILIAMFLLNPWLALATLIVVPVMFWFTNFIASYTRKSFRGLQKNLGQLNGLMEENISGLRVVKAFRRNESAIEKFRQYNQEVYKSAVSANSYALLLMPLTNQLGNFFVIVLAGLGGWLALQGLVTVGTIVTFISYARNFINPLRQISNLYNSIQAALAGAERVFEIMDIPSEYAADVESTPLDKIQGHVRLDGVDFSYVPGKPVIRNMTLEAQPGETIALVGPTGAGKTTIVNLLNRFYEIDAGAITIDGHDYCRLDKDDLRRQLGLVLQDTYLFAATVMENIRYGRLEASDEEVIQAAKMADADYFIHLLPDGYQTVLSERGSNLSQGQRQLLAIARAILADPAILILDEATSSVDTRTEAHIQQSLLRLMQGRTSFVIAHRLSTIREADQLLVIKDGEIIERGTHDSLLAQKGFYHHLYMSQFKGEAI
jgi:ATP-binding cassette subfamily B protein